MKSDQLPQGSIAELQFAMNTARKAHGDIQHIRVIGDDTGKPYFDTHVVRVIRAVPPWAKPAAALHDVLEDCDPTNSWSVYICDVLSEETEKAVRLLTRQDGVSYDDYIERILRAQGLGGRIARVVKLADLMDNLRTLPSGSLRQRYIQAMGRIASDISMNREGGWDLDEQER